MEIEKKQSTDNGIFSKVNNSRWRCRKDLKLKHPLEHDMRKISIEWFLFQTKTEWDTIGEVQATEASTDKAIAINRWLQELISSSVAPISAMFWSIVACSSWCWCWPSCCCGWWCCHYYINCDVVVVVHDVVVGFVGAEFVRSTT
jgi:hypothetical protein